jgi:hypothetical protein
MRSRDVCVSRPWPSVVVAMLLLLGSIERAAADPEEGRVSGFTTNATGELRGEVKDNDGSPLADIEVHITSSQGEHVVKTDRQGTYRIDLGPWEGQKFVFVRRIARINGKSVETSSLETGEEVFEIKEAEKPKIMPKPTSGTNIIPGYSDEAREKDVWARAWLMLEIDDKGNVSRLKLLHSPGYGLDEIALRAAGDLSFEPARSISGKPVAALVLWVYEWPAYYWLIERKLSPERLTEVVETVPCASEPSNRARLRDCTKADLTRAAELPWIPAVRSPDRVLLGSGKWAKRAYWYDDTLGWALTGGSAVIGAAAIYLLISAGTAEDEANREMSETRRAQKLDQAQIRRIGGYVLSGLGLGMLGVGTARLILHTDGETTAQVGLVGRF